MLLTSNFCPSADPHRQLEASLKRLVTNYPPAKVPLGGGLYRGPVSIAYTFVVLQQMYQDLQIEGEYMGAWAAAYLQQAQSNITGYPGPVVGKCGVTDDILALLAIGAATSKDADMVKQLCDYAAEAVDPDTGNDFLYGRAGFLYLLRLAKASFNDDPKALQMITDVQDDVVDAILDSPRPWKTQGKNYIGTLSGAIGIITQIVLTDPQQYADQVRTDLAVILTYQYDSGNFPATVPPEKDRLVEVEHGAPGVVVSLLSIRDYFPQLHDKIDKAIARARSCILERGLLTKEPSLMNGISGNALALESPNFEHFLSFTTGKEMESLRRDNMLDPSDYPESLFEGEAGRAWCWAVADLNLPRRVLGYNDL